MHTALTNPAPVLTAKRRVYAALLAWITLSAAQPGCGSDPVLPDSETSMQTPEPGDAALVGLQVSDGVLSPAFSPQTKLYSILVPFEIQSEQVIARTKDSRAALLVNGARVDSGRASSVIGLETAVTTITVAVEAPGGVKEQYTLVVRKGRLDTQYLKASNTGRGDRFGASVRFEGDTLAVSAPNEGSAATGINGDQLDDSAPESGAVYVFRLRDGLWQQEAYLKASNTEAGDNFGSSLALSGDTLAVGALDESSKATGVDDDQADNSASSSGAVYVFRRTGTVWQQEAYIKASNTQTEDQFGQGVVLSGDTLAVCARGEDSKATGINGDQTDNSEETSGAVYVFRRTDTGWQQEAYVKASNAERFDYFGASMVLSGDTLAIGGLQEDSSATGVNGDQSDESAQDSGALYIFRRTDGTWAQEAYIKASGTMADANWGRVSLSGDMLAVGADRESGGATGINGSPTASSSYRSGAVYILRRANGTWVEDAYIKASNAEERDLFGLSVSLSGNMLAVGARMEDSNATGINGSQADNSAADSGAVYLFIRTATGWTQRAYLKAPYSDPGDNFGTVFLSGNRLFVGAPGESSTATGINGNPMDNGAASSGAVYVLTEELPN